MAGDPYYSSVGLLLHCDGSNGSSTFTDSSPTPKTPTASGAVISTAQAQWGQSGYFDGTNDYLSIPAHADFVFGTGAFTIDAWIYPTANNKIIIANSVASSDTSWQLMISGTGKLQFLTYLTVLAVGATTITLNAWSHVSVAFDGTTYRVFLNGTMDGSGTTLKNLSSSNTLYIGTNGAFSGYYSGHIDDVRITKGIARQTSTFSVPTAAYPDAAPIVSGIVRDSSNALCARTLRAYDRTTGALVGSTASNGTTGAYTMNCSTLNEVSVLCLDDVAGTTENDLVLRTTPA